MGMIAHTRTIAHPGQPQIKEARLVQAHDHAKPVKDERSSKNPRAAKDQKQLDRNDQIDHEKRIGDPRKHLRPRKRDE